MIVIALVVLLDSKRFNRNLDDEAWLIIGRSAIRTQFHRAVSKFVTRSNRIYSFIGESRERICLINRDSSCRHVKTPMQNQVT